MGGIPFLFVSCGELNPFGPLQSAAVAVGTLNLPAFLLSFVWLRGRMS